jgi:DNA-binding response OmpR family regulator
MSKQSNVKKILVVDDDQDILDAVQLILDTEGFDCDVTTKGDETYKKIELFQPNLIILDVLLSGNDGRIICKKLKDDTKTKHIPIVMISAHPSAKNSVKECGADSFVAKPFSIQDLLLQINSLIS